MKSRILGALIVVFLTGCADNSNVSRSNSSPSAISMPDKPSSSSVQMSGYVDTSYTTQTK